MIKHCILIVSILLFLSGCSFKINKTFDPITREKYDVNYTQIGVLILDNNLTVENDIDEGALYGLRHGAIDCLKYGQGGEVGIIFAVACLPVNAIVDATIGIKESIHLNDLQKERGTIEANIPIPDLQAKSRDIALNYLRENTIDSTIVENNLVRKKDNTNDYSILAKNGIDTLLEFKITKISLHEAGMIGVPVDLTLEIDSKLVDTENGNIIAKLSRKVLSNAHQYQEWVADDFKLLKEESNALLSMAIKASIDEYLLLYYPHYTNNFATSSNQRNAPYYVLAPYYPETQFGFSPKDQVVFVKREFEAPLLQRFVTIKEKNPLLKWEAFPWKYDQLSLNRISDVTYDLEIHKYMGPLVYVRKGIKENHHHVEDALEDGTKYFWTVRARFRVDGKPRVTEWGGLYRDLFPAWVYGDKNLPWYGKGRDLPLSEKLFYYYPFMILQE